MGYPRPPLTCPLICLLQIDPKVAFPRRAQPKVGVQIVRARTRAGEAPLSWAVPGNGLPGILFCGRCVWNLGLECLWGVLGVRRGDTCVVRNEDPVHHSTCVLGWAADGLACFGKERKSFCCPVFEANTVWTLSVILAS